MFKVLSLVLIFVISGCSVSYTQKSTNLFNVNSKAHSLCELSNIDSCHVWQCFSEDVMFNNDNKFISFEVMHSKEKDLHSGYLFLENKMSVTKFNIFDYSWTLGDSKIKLKDNKFKIFSGNYSNYATCTKTYTKT